MASSLHPSQHPQSYEMPVATSFNDLQPVRAVDEAEALRISNKIDEDLKVRLLPCLAHHTTCFDGHAQRSSASSFGDGKHSRRKSKVCVMTYSCFGRVYLADTNSNTFPVSNMPAQAPV